VRRSAGVAVAVLLVGSQTRAGGLDDLRAALEKLRARDPVRARITQENRGEFDDDGQKRTRQGRATIVAEDGGGGQPLRLVYDDAVLTQAAREQAGRRDSRGPGDAVRDLDALRVLDLLRSAENLLNDLAGARVTSETADRAEGRAGRVLELSLRAPKGIDQEKGFRVGRTARISIDADGAPISSEIRTHTEVRRLVFKVRFDTTERNAFAVAGHRLVTRRRETENRWKASIFAAGSNHSVTTVEVLE
jgi:hypothetical protein